MQKAIDILKKYFFYSDVKIVSAQITPEVMFDYATNALSNDIIIMAKKGAASYSENGSIKTNIFQHFFS